MPDICLQVMINASTSDLGGDREIRKYRNGDIVQGMRATDIATESGGIYTPNNAITSPRTGFIFVTGVPVSAALKIKEKLSEAREDVQGIVSAVRLHGFTPSEVPAVKRNELINNKYTQVTWANLKQFIKNKREDRLITDADFN